ncbi:MAG: HNH endonuclease [Bacteroidetes bacterium]|nr:HNH endonuclease [Bacteroidota bacterium]
MLKLYDARCLITGCEIESVLDAAHIISHSSSGLNSQDNGILLRSDIYFVR